MPEPYGWITFSDEDFARFSEDPKKDSRILECVYDPNWQTIEYNPDDMRERTWDNPRVAQGGWRFERIRDDKKTANDKRVVSSVEQSVRDGVTAPELLSALGVPAALSSLGAFAPQAERGEAQHGGPQAAHQPPSSSTGPAGPAASTSSEAE